MSNPAQGAVGAETITVRADIFRNLLEAARPFYACVFNDNGDVSVSTGHITIDNWLRLDRAFHAASEPAALASPRADSDERTAFRPGDLVRNARYKYPDAYPALGESAYVQAVDGDYLDFGQGSKLLDSLFDLATPAHPAGAVPDSLRRAFATFDADPGSNALYWHCHHLAYGFVRSLLASHLTGQSAGSGADLDMPLAEDVQFPGVKFGKGVTLRTVIEAARRWKADADAACLAKLPAPDSTRTGQGEAGLSWRDMKDAPKGTPIIAKHKPNSSMPHGWVAVILLGHRDEEEAGSLDTILHYNGNALYSGFHGCWDGWLPVDALAARPAAPEAQGAWSWTARDGHPIRNGEFGEQWLLTWSEGSATYDVACIDNDWPHGEPIKLLCVDAWKWIEASPGEPPAPPASSGQGGR